MTSPNIDKPVAGPEGYDSVYARGSSYGQGLDRATIEALLTGRVPGDGGLGSSIGSSIIEMGSSVVGGFVDFILSAGSAIYNVVAEIFGWDKRELPPLWESFSEDVFLALEPLYTMADRAIEEAKDSQEAAEALTEQLTGSIDGDFAEAIDNYLGALGMLALHVDEVKAQIPEITAASEAITKAEQDVAAAVKDFDATVVAVGVLAESVEASNEEYEAQVKAAEEAAIRVELSTEEYDSRVADAEQLLLEMSDTQEETAASAKEVQDLLGSEEWNKAVTGFIFWQDQLNSDQSEFNQGVQSALEALDMVADDQSEFNQGVQDALWVQDQVNRSQSDFNVGVQASLDALDMVTDKQSEFNKGVKSAVDALEAFANLQTEVNSSVKKSLETLAGVVHINEIHWQTQAEYNKTNNEINRAQNEALELHENQLTMLQDTLPRSWVFYTDQVHTRSPWISCRLYSGNVLNSAYVEIVALGSWKGRIVFSISFYDQGTGSDSAVDQYDFLVNGSTGSSRTVKKYAGAVHMGIKNVAVTVYPYWGNSKREFLLKPDSGRSYNGWIPTSAYDNDLEGSPVAFSSSGSVRFPYTRVRANTTVRVQRTSGYTYYSAGSVLPENSWIRPSLQFSNAGDLVKFTEY